MAAVVAGDIGEAKEFFSGFGRIGRGRSGKA
jgi:hypothetical protein